MTDLLLISLNREQSPYPVFPIGVWVLYAYLTRLGFSVEVADMNLLQDFEELENRYLKNRIYRYAGISIRNIDNLSWPDSISYLPQITEGVQLLKQYFSREQIIPGGAGYSIFGQLLLDHLDLPQGIRGDGEKAMARILGASDPLPEPDFAYAQHTPEDILQTYYRQAGMLGIQTRRGCPFACDYCTYPSIEGPAFRLRPVESVIEELRFLSDEYGINVFYLVDCLINSPPGYTLKLTDALAKANLPIRWYGFAGPDHIDNAFAARLKAAGCAGLEIGSESGSDTILTAMQKTFRAEDILHASQACHEQRIKFCHYLMLGSADETEQTVRESLELMKHCEGSTVIISIGIRLYPGTPLLKKAQQQNRASYEPTDLLKPVFLQPRAIDLPEILEICKEQGPRHWVYPGISDSLNADKMRLLRERGIKGPLWDYL